ncbi:hypothetical protein COLO4_09822 [Corchorus olitorius]|uniref:DEK C-terminal domain-containing protein n=1 Tax=Corchorus olitorius TaxID=93759 RepID=A0A1R3KB01_9ROSI|nr:hypothetical protein COLO4_09822 [Corchorus olitorius]
MGEEETKTEAPEPVANGTSLPEKCESKGSKGSKKRGKVQNAGEKVKGKAKKAEEKKEPEQRTPLTNRPVRERKSVERLVATVDKEASKELQIEKGRGTPLKDIPNVAFKLSRRKTEDTFRLLHTILFGRRGKAVQIKSNISRFSGFVWHENEEDMVSKLIDFLVAPHATTTVLLAEKEKEKSSNKSKKRKRVTKSGTTSKRSAKASSGKKESAGKAKPKKVTVPKKSSAPQKRTPKASSKSSKADDDSDKSPKVSSRKKTEKAAKEKSSTPAKSASKEKAGKKVAKGKDKAKEEKLKPTDHELRDAICEILKVVDFNTVRSALDTHSGCFDFWTLPLQCFLFLAPRHYFGCELESQATFTDILKQLARQFDTDLTPRKASIKLMIQEELTKLADEADDEDGEGDAEKDDTQSAGQEVEA